MSMDGQFSTHTASYHLHMPSLHFQAMSVSNTCCITHDYIDNKDEEGNVG